MAPPPWSASTNGVINTLRADANVMQYGMYIVQRINNPVLMLGEPSIVDRMLPFRRLFQLRCNSVELCVYATHFASLFAGRQRYVYRYSDINVINVPIMSKRSYTSVFFQCDSPWHI